ncbi:MAG: hypothetical protein HY901_17255 [Deltaproteobacteria bacterium]|nr:hypothetical protein [Deltaproteobacteria bacterium]
MKRSTRKTTRLGDLIAAVFDEAGRFSTNPREVSRLATRVVRHLMRQAQRVAAPQPVLCLQPAHAVKRHS